jgi:hypothetical protein
VRQSSMSSRLLVKSVGFVAIAGLSVINTGL